MADVKFAVIRDSLGKDLNDTTDFEEADFGTPKAAIVLLSNAYTTGNPAIGLITSIGFWDGTNQNVHAVGSLDNIGQSVGNSTRSAATDHIVHVASGGTVYAECTASNAPGGNGIRLTLSVDATGVERYATVILIGGSDVSADTGSLECDPVENSSNDETSLSYEPDVAFFSCIGYAGTALDSATAEILSFGVAVNDGSETQRAMLLGAVDNVGTTVTNERVETSDDSGTHSVAGQLWNNILQHTQELTAFNADGFTLTSRDGGAGGDYVFWLTLNLGGGDMWLDTLTTPTSSGLDTSYSTSPGFTPSVVMAAGCTASASDTTTGAQSFSIGASDGTQHSAIASRNRDNQSTSDTDSESREKVIDIRTESDGSDLTDATLSSFDTNGFTLNYGNADSTAFKGWILAMGDGAAPTEWAIVLDSTSGSTSQVSIAYNAPVILDSTSGSTSQVATGLEYPHTLASTSGSTSQVAIGYTPPGLPIVIDSTSGSTSQVATSLQYPHTLASTSGSTSQLAIGYTPPGLPIVINSTSGSTSQIATGLEYSHTLDSTSGSTSQIAIGYTPAGLPIVIDSTSGSTSQVATGLEYAHTLASTSDSTSQIVIGYTPAGLPIVLDSTSDSTSQVATGLEYPRTLASTSDSTAQVAVVYLADTYPITIDSTSGSTANLTSVLVAAVTLDSPSDSTSQLSSTLEYAHTLASTSGSTSQVAIVYTPPGGLPVALDSTSSSTAQVATSLEYPVSLNASSGSSSTIQLKALHAIIARSISASTADINATRYELIKGVKDYQAVKDVSRYLRVKPVNRTLHVL